MTTNRSAIIAKLYKVLKKHYKPVSPPTDRSALEHLLYACLLENSRYDAADEAFAKLKELYFDWNEIRVTTVTELAEGMGGVADASSSAQRVKRSLQSVFEGGYSFDIESLKKQNLGKAEKDLEKVNGASPFVRAYVTQHALGGHYIPISKGAIDLLHAVGIISDNEADKGQVPGLERAIPKNKGTEFGSLLQQLAADLFASPGSSKVKAILSEVDPDFKERMATRQARLEAQAAADAAAAKQARDKARADARAAAEVKTKPTGKRDKDQKDKSTGKPADKGTFAAGDKKGPAKGKEPGKEPAKESLKDKPMPAAKKRPEEESRRPIPAKGLAKKKPR